MITHFHQFPHRMAFTGSFGAGKIGEMQLNIVSDPHAWKRMRSTLTPGFTQRQMADMYQYSKEVIHQLCGDLRKRDGKQVDSLTVASKFSMEAFLKW
jgi:cytochrome P450